MGSIFKYLSALQPEVLSIFFGILLAGACGYWGWARPALSRAWRELEQFAEMVEVSDPAGDRVTALNSVADATPVLQQAWKATSSRLLVVGYGESQRRVLLGSVSDVWHSERLLHKHFNLSLFEAVPNIAVGVGLFFTFLFLTLALTDATTALSAAGAANPIGATQGLLSSAGGKFMSSLAGLAVSLCWTIASKRVLARVQRASERVVVAIEKWWAPVGAEAVVLQQLDQLRSVGESLSGQQVTALEHRDISGELLVEAREQTGVLKRFETDLAMSIGKAVTAGFSPQMEQMTSRLEKAISELSERMSSMNEDALRTMMKDFSQAISANTADEMKQFKETLSALSGKLDSSAQMLTVGIKGAALTMDEAAQGMASGISAAAEKMSSDIASASQSLTNSVSGMEEVISRATEAVQEIDVTVRRAAALGANGVEHVGRSIESAQLLVDEMGNVGEAWKKVSRDLSELVAKITETSDAVEELSEGQRAVVRTVQAAGPEVLNAVEKVRTHMEDTSRAVADAMQKVQGAMGRTSEDLTGVVTAIKDGVTEYSRQLASLHLNMDTAMAGAVSKLGGAIQNLDESIEDLNDGLEGFRGKV